MTSETMLVRRSRWLREPEITLGALILVSFVGFATLQVVTRYVFGRPFVWTEEISAHLLIWMTYIGATGVQRVDGHIRVELLDSLLRPDQLRWVYAFYDLLIVFCLAMLIYGGWTLYTSMRFERLPALRWPLRYILVVAPVCASIMLVYTVRNMVGRFRARTAPA